ncbi:MAG: AbrB/MazE/SpoVT family DNA-binding domain-containing protein [Azospirillaceae bacterium]|nr:AbrB/MazE/SpoVT family DNA-binding domain-containing protein [Azospirillaceae bacterium]
MSSTRRVRLHRNADGQVVHIPSEFALPGEDAVMRRDGSRLIIEPLGRRQNSLSALLAGWESLNDGLPAIPDPPPDAVDL